VADLIVDDAELAALYDRMAFAMTAAIRHHANSPTPPKTKAWIERLLQQS
jgi:hypothetical protein